MNFGKLPSDALNKVNFKLPPDGIYTEKILQLPTTEQPIIRVGGTSWTEKAWKGKIYPTNTSNQSLLKAYAQQFSTLELNATHYKIYSEDQFKRWAEQVSLNPNFKFCPKITNSISHYSDLSSDRAKRLMDEFCVNMQGLGQYLGPCFLQLSEKFTTKRRDELISFLTDLPIDVELHLEVRDDSWFNDPFIFEELWRTAKGTVITDVAGRRDCAHMQLTTKKAMVRFVANDLHPTDYTRIDDWVNRIENWSNRGLEELYFFVHQPDDVRTPELADYLIKELQVKTKLEVQSLDFVQKELSLFD